jgi:hypothetical protein
MQTLQSPSRRAALLLAWLIAVGAAPLAAQASPCPADTTTSSRICQAGADALTAFLPIEGLLVSGGNPVPGTAAAVGKFGHARLAFRVGVASLTVPKTTYDGTTDTVLADKRLLVPLPRIDLALGLFSKKLPLGTAAVDLLGSAVLLPTGVTTRIQIDDNARSIGPLALGLGYGFRAALLMKSPMPTVSLNVMKRDMPTIRFGDRARGDNLAVTTSLSAINARLIVGAHASGFSIAGGAGLDLYKGSGTVAFADSAGADTTVTVDLSTSRIMTLLNLGYDLGPLGVWVEGGFQVGKKTKLATVFQRNDPSSGHFYAGAGATIHF